ncbi:hypothetical protein CAPTEDRAFT_210739 [Capitella teleta]|uniref:Guanylate cyclase n=1 Tax=Capitella teleta TaxID=283909 RepID=R7UA56_CAPTE|nr:hypothetical protein CAPTEDRAFT_210739 [Capitella teleta]|eukprot:ELU03250.1 hypothetical protein CAPTEDRAFT_210739 [Capitella teleta]
MVFIHRSEIQYHGRLRSSNCVVDSRFVLKITDFGIPCFYYDDDAAMFSAEYKDHTNYEKLLWVAPEHLRESVPNGSQKGDVYSFSIILEEIILRGKIVMRVKRGGTEPIRPYISKDSCPAQLRTLLAKCWSEDPQQRPTFDTIKSTISKMHGGKERSLLESLLKRMEMYANNLESIVAERTSLLAQEQEKTEQLLLQILPKSIAEQLKRGQHVQPETYHNVTIYFSDIVGFTTLSAESSPLQIVKLLNDLYTTFDSTLGKYDVYKVETIGDAYMVASGLPITNGDKHASEIACMSLELLESITRFKIAHRPHQQLKLRIGLHSGSCVAGVVGLKMPRYCLFGDTVNTASRMESHGEALKIHISPETKRLLDRFGSFQISSRGVITIKGKGEMETFWLENSLK